MANWCQNSVEVVGTGIANFSKEIGELQALALELNQGVLPTGMGMDNTHLFDIKSTVFNEGDRTFWFTTTSKWDTPIQALVHLAEKHGVEFNCATIEEQYSVATCGFTIGVFVDGKFTVISKVLQDLGFGEFLTDEIYENSDSDEGYDIMAHANNDLEQACYEATITAFRETRDQPDKSSTIVVNNK